MKTEDILNRYPVGALVALGDQASTHRQVFTNRHGESFILAPQSRADGGYYSELVRIPSDVMALPKMEGCPIFEDVAGFCAYVKTFKLPGTLIFAKDRQRVAIIDWHANKTSAGRGEHRACLNTRLTPEFIEWSNASGKLVSQRAMVEFLHDNQDDIGAGDGSEGGAAAAIDYVSNFGKVRRQTVRSKINGDSDDIESVFTDTSDQSRMIFGTILQPIEGLDKAYEIKAVITHEVDDNGKVLFSFELKRLDRVMLMAQRALDEQIKTDTSITPYKGSID